MLKPETVEREIIRELTLFPSTATKRDLTDGQWTKGIKKLIGDLGTKHGYNVCTGGLPQRFERGWLFDLIWYKNDAQDKLIEFPLVMESEWSWKFDSLRYDFEKLLVIRTSVRLFIFQARNQASIEDITRRLIEQVSIFPQTQWGDRYLFVGYDNKLNQFDFRPFVY